MRHACTYRRRVLAAGLIVWLAGPCAHAADLPPDPISTWTLQNDSASVTTSPLSDRYNVNGLRIGLTSGSNAMPVFLTGVGRALWGDGQQRWSFDLSQLIDTPDDTAFRGPVPGDRPYAGVLLGTFSLLQDVEDSRSTFSLGLGVIGPAAQGEELQNGFHDVLGQQHAVGWSNQIHNEPLLEVTSARVWRLPTGTLAGLETDALPDLTVGLGNLRIYAQTGVLLRLGEGLDSDYGPARVQSGIGGGDAFRATQTFAWYVFAGADGQAVAHDITINGNDFQTSESAKLVPWQAELEAGAAIMLDGARLTYTQLLQTAAIEHQKHGFHQLGSLALSLRF